MSGTSPRDEFVQSSRLFPFQFLVYYDVFTTWIIQGDTRRRRRRIALRHAHTHYGMYLSGDNALDTIPPLCQFFT